jgi:hypothetical protein
MSVRATDSLIAEIVKVSGLANSPKMVVRAVQPETKLITTVWFSDANEAQESVFPAGSLEKVDVSAPAAKKQPAKSAKKGK